MDYLNECIILFVIALDSQNGVSRTTCTDAHLDHLRVEEVGEILLVDIWCNAAYV